MFKNKQNIIWAVVIAAATVGIIMYVRNKNKVVALPLDEKKTAPETINDETVKSKMEINHDKHEKLIDTIKDAEHTIADKKSNIHHSPLLYVLTANKDGNVFTDPAFKSEGEQFKKDEVIGIINSVEWRQLQNAQSDFPIRFIYTKEFAGKKIESGKSKQIDPRSVEVNIKRLPVRFVHKDTLSLNGTFYHPVKIS